MCVNAVQQNLVVVFFEGPREENATPEKMKNTSTRYKFVNEIGYLSLPYNVEQTLFLCQPISCIGNLCTTCTHTTRDGSQYLFYSQ